MDNTDYAGFATISSELCSKSDTCVVSVSILMYS